MLYESITPEQERTAGDPVRAVDGEGEGDGFVARTHVRVGSHVHTALVAGPADGERVLLLHGFPQFAESWSQQLTALGTAGYRALAVDQRGYANAARPDRVADYALDRLVDDALAFAAALGGGPFHLVGHDWGGLVAWAVASAHPDLLASLTVLSTPHPTALRQALAADPDQVRRSSYIPYFQQPGGVAEAALLAHGAAGLRHLYAEALPPHQVDTYVTRLAGPGALTAALNWYRALPEAPTPPAGRIEVPTLFVWGDQDPALGRTAAEATGALVDADYRFEVLADAGHWLPEAHARFVEPALLAHLAAHAANRP